MKTSTFNSVRTATIRARTAPKRSFFLGAASAVLLALGATDASATTLTTVDGSYSLSYSDVVGNKPTITYRLNHTSFAESVPTFSSQLIATPMTPMQFFTTGPAGSCGTNCVNHTASEDITVNFNFKEASTGATGSLSVTGIYEAKYSGTSLPCDPHTGGNVQTDCVYWYPGAYTSSDTAPLKESVTLSNGDILNVFLYFAHDWAITPDISFDLVHLPTSVRPTPLPPAVALFGSALGLAGFLSRRRAKARAAARSGDAFISAVA